MTESEQYIPFKFIGNGFNESHLPFTSGNQWYFQNQYRYRSILFRPIPSSSFSLKSQSRSCLCKTIVRNGVKYVKHFHVEHFHVVHFHVEHFHVEHFYVQHFYVEHFYVEHFHVEHFHVEHFHVEHFNVEHFYVEHFYVEHFLSK
jgi:hypothetical protein